MDLFGLRETNGPPCHPLYAGAQLKVSVFYFLRVDLANHMLAFGNKPGVTAPVVGVIFLDVENLQLGHQLLADLVLAASEDKRQGYSRRRVNGPPQPSRVFLVADIAPLLINLDFPRRIKEMADLWHNLLNPDVGIHVHHLGSTLFEVGNDGVLADTQYTGGIADAAAIQGHGLDLFLDTGFAGAIGILVLEDSTARFAAKPIMAALRAITDHFGTIAIPTMNDLIGHRCILSSLELYTHT